MLRPGHGLMLIAITLLTLGVVMVNSAGLSIDPDRALSVRDVLLGRPMILAALAVGALLLGVITPAGSIFTSRGLASPIPWIILAMILLLLAVHVPGLGREVNGAKRWLALGPIGFQPSEIAKWGLVIVLAWHAARRAGSMGRITTGFLPPMILVAAVCLLVGTEDLGTAALIGAVSVVMLIAGGAKLWQAGLLIPAGAAAFIAAVITSPYRVNRLHAFFDPYQDPQGIGYHVLQSMAAVGGGSLAGRGLGNSVQKFGYLPEATTDFIFAIICEELGIIGAIVVVSLYAGLILCGLSIIRGPSDHDSTGQPVNTSTLGTARANNSELPARTARRPPLTPFHRLLGFGVLLTIALQALINLAVVTGMAPTKGIALPLLSAGGTGWILTAYCIGLLAAIERENSRFTAEQAGSAEQITDQPLMRADERRWMPEY